MPVINRVAKCVVAAGEHGQRNMEPFTEFEPSYGSSLSFVEWESGKSNWNTRAMIARRKIDTSDASRTPRMQRRFPFSTGCRKVFQQRLPFPIVSCETAGVSSAESDCRHMGIAERNRDLFDCDMRPNHRSVDFTGELQLLSRFRQGAARGGARDFVSRDSGIGRPLGLKRAIFGVDGSLSRIPSRCTGSAQREQSYEGTNISKDPAGIGRALASIGGLPLGAKIAGTVVAAIIAWLVMLAGFVRILKSRRDIPQGTAYIALGCAVWLASGLLWLSGS
jgi:hypothetical protein